MASKDAEKKKSWRETLVVYFQLPILWCFLLGIASGFPFLLTGSTLLAWLQESGINIKTIGVFAAVGLPYTLKFLLAPFVDSIHLMKSASHLIHRKSWLLISQILLVLTLTGLSFVDPTPDMSGYTFTAPAKLKAFIESWTIDYVSVEYGSGIILVAVLAFLTALFSALQDIVIDALRIEIVEKDNQGAGAAALVAGYRIGMLLTGAGALFLAMVLPWNTVYLIGAGVMFLIALSTLTISRIDGYTEACAEGRVKPPKLKGSYRDWFVEAVWAPIGDFITRPAAWLTLLFIVTFKLGEAMAGSLSMPFYLQLGFSKAEIAAISKVFGVVAVIAGSFIGGFIVKRMSIVKALFLCGSLQLASNLCFVWLSYAGNNNIVLTATITIENVTAGMNTAAFVAFMSQLCNVRFTATQYALLSSVSTVGRTLIAMSCGFLVAHLGWNGFFVFTVFCGIPGLVLVFFVAPTLPKGEVLNKDEDGNETNDNGNSPVDEGSHVENDFELVPKTAKRTHLLQRFRKKKP